MKFRRQQDLVDAPCYSDSGYLNRGVTILGGITMKSKLIASAMFALVLSGCASRYAATPYTAPATPIQSVALAQDIAPAEASAFDVASVGSNFGLIGALTDAGVQSSRKDRVNEALTSVQFDAEKEIGVFLAEALKGKSIQVSALDGADRKKREFLLKYPQETANAQAFLDVVVLNYGYVSAGSGQPSRRLFLQMFRWLTPAVNRLC